MSDLWSPPRAEEDDTPGEPDTPWDEPTGDDATGDAEGEPDEPWR